MSLDGNRRLLPLLVVAISLLVAPPALSGTLEDILDDCTDNGRLDRQYSRSQLRHARHNMTSEIAEYTDCGDILRRAELREAGGDGPTGGPPSSGGSAPAAPLLEPVDGGERTLLAKARSEGGRPVRIAGGQIAPGAAGFKAAAARNPLPPGLLVIVVAMLAALLAGSVRAATRWSSTTHSFKPRRRMGR
jgi:hypothetical protein